MSSIARKHGVMPKPFLGRPQYPPPFKKSSFFPKEYIISQEREFGLLKSAIMRK
jgi:hypothetical protein